MFWNKQRTAILIRKYRDIVSTDSTGGVDDFDFIVSDERPQDRHRNSSRDHIDVFDGLGRNLPNAIPRNKYASFLSSSNLFCQPHHVASIENHTGRHRSVHHDVSLHVGEWDEINLRSQGVLREQA